MRRSLRPARPARLVGLLLVVGLVVALSGCASPGYQFVGSDDRDMIMRIPRSWTAFDTDVAMKASGIDPATRTGWITFFDGSPDPDVKHIQTTSDDEPLLFAETIPLTKEQGATVTGDALRELVLPADPDTRAAATKAHLFAVLENQIVSSPTQQGIHMKYSFKFGKEDEIFDEVALMDPKHTRVYRLFVHCTKTCFAAHSAEIAAVISSLTLKST